MRHFLILLFAIQLFAIDATLEVIKKVKYTPTVLLQDCSKDNSVSTPLIRKFNKILIGDLKVSGIFSPNDTYVVSNIGDKLDYKELKANKNDLVLRYSIEGNSNGLDVKFWLFDVASKKIVLKGNHSVPSSFRFPFLAHKIAIATSKYMGENSIAWMDKFIIFSKVVASGKNNIVLADYTLTYQEAIVRGGLNIFPKWANKKQNSFYYTSLSDPIPTLYKIDIYKGTKTKIISGSGMLVCSDVSSNGRKLLLTMAPDDQADIYLYDTQNRTTSKLTKFKGIDVGGKFIDNDRRIAFVSDRLGYPNIFAKTIGGSAIERLVYHGKNNNSCTTSGSYIAYVSRDKESEFARSFNIYLISTRSNYIRQLTSIGKNQFPNFSQNGETMMFIKKYKNQNAIGIIRINLNKTFLFPLNVGKIQSIDW
jgi:TolB protein